MKVLGLLATVLLVACSSMQTVLKEYKSTPSYQAVVDSIMNSGTGVGMEKTAVFTLDDGRKDTVIVHTLYRDQKAVGTLQVRSLGEGQYNMMIIDQEEKK